jgi:membrane protein
MAASVLRIVSQTFRRFGHDKCWTSSIVISYLVLLSLIPLLALFAYLTAQVLGDTEIAFRSLNLFTDEFFAKLDPAFFERLRELSGSIKDLGLFGLLGSLVAGSVLFSQLIHTLNHIFRARYHKSFFYNRFIEFAIMFAMGVVMFFSLALTTLWETFEKSIEESWIIFINPKAIAFVNNVFIQYLIPYLLTFLVFFLLYKLIPEVNIHTKSALISASIAALLYEIFKRFFAFYVAHISAIGIVLSKVLQGTLTSFIFFMLWVTSSLVILLWGAELAALLNERRNIELSQRNGLKKPS